MNELSQQVAEKAERAVDQLCDRSNDSLDYSESSLSVVEDMLAEAAHFIDEMPAEQIDALVNMLGSYVLEVGRREFGGKYYWHDGRDQPVLVVGEPEYKIAMLTFDKVRGRLSGDEADNIPFLLSRIRRTCSQCGTRGRCALCLTRWSQTLHSKSLHRSWLGPQLSLRLNLQTIQILFGVGPPTQ
jgi:hypothetical protein